MLDRGLHRRLGRGPVREQVRQHRPHPRPRASRPCCPRRSASAARSSSCCRTARSTRRRRSTGACRRGGAGLRSRGSCGGCRPLLARQRERRLSARPSGSSGSGPTARSPRTSTTRRPPSARASTPTSPSVRVAAFAAASRKQAAPKENSMTLAGKTILMSGGSRGIGLAIALRAARDGANIAILAKTDTPHPKLEGTVHTAARADPGCRWPGAADRRRRAQRRRHHRGRAQDAGRVRRHRHRREQRERHRPLPVARPRGEEVRPHAGRQRARHVPAEPRRGPRS